MSDNTLLQTIGLPALPKQIDLPGNNVLDVNALNKAATAAVGQSAEFIINTGLALLLIAGSWIFTRWLSQWLQRGLLRARVEETFAAFISSILMYLLFLLAVLAGLRLMGVSDTSLVTVLGASALAIGFALRGTLTHVASGIMLITNRPFRIGDWIQLDALEGRVRRITLFNTEVATIDNKRVFIPNTKIWEGTLLNHTYSRERMVEIVMRAGYATPPEEMKSIYFEALKGDDRVLPRPEPVFGIKAMAPEGVDYLIQVWVRTGDYAAMKLALPMKLWNAVRKAGLVIPGQPWSSGVVEAAPAPEKKKKAKK
ncbi:MAG TPA: mechanosensitive ion channel family protein [Alphaproteobacteria bacterium]|nr:mechanosensitive ion channel family protein [Alphaproteobacteria bacterium]